MKGLADEGRANHGGTRFVRSVLRQPTERPSPLQANARRSFACPNQHRLRFANCGG